MRYFWLKLYNRFLLVDLIPVNYFTLPSSFIESSQHQKNLGQVS